MNWVGELIERAKSEYYNDKIIKCGRDQRVIFKIVENILHHRSVVLSNNASSRHMVQAFGALYRIKIVVIRNGLESGLINDRESVVSDTHEVTNAIFVSFQLVSETGIHAN